MANPEDGSSMSTDRISDLPEEILQRILYYLCQKEAVRTSVLSKSWRYIWYTRPNLDLDLSYHSERKIITVMNNSLQRYYDQRLCLEEFYLTICLGTHSYHQCVSHLRKNLVSHLENWIGRLKNMGVKDFCLSVNWVGIRVDAPSVVFEAESLKLLHLENCMLVQNSVVKLAIDRLQELRLCHVTVEKEIFDKIISSCPLLTTMWLENCEGLKTITLDKKLHKYLKHFTFINQYSIKGNLCIIQIDVPNLETIKIVNTKIRFHCNKFDHLKSLTLHRVLTYSDSTEKSQLVCDIDAPNISYFEYSGVFIPSISFTPTSGRSNIQLYIDGVVDGLPWFLELSKLLQALNQSEISLNIFQLQENIVHLEEEQILAQGMINGGNKPVVVEHLEFAVRLLLPSFFNGLFCICRPKKITPSCFISMKKREKKEAIECLCNTLMMRESGNQDLVDLRIECFDPTLSKWQPVQRATSSECALPGNDVRFLLKWSDSCQSSSKLHKI